MPVCSDCDALISYLHSRVPSGVHTHKNVIEVLRAAPDCDLCNLLISVEFQWQDHGDNITGSISLYNTEEDLCSLEALAKEEPERFPPIRVMAREDVCARLSEVVFEVRYICHRLGRIFLAIWKDSPCADIDAECERNTKDFFSDHLFSRNAAENRWDQFRPCSTSAIAYRPFSNGSERISNSDIGVCAYWEQAVY